MSTREKGRKEKERMEYGDDKRVGREYRKERRNKGKDVRRSMRGKMKK